MVDFRVTSNLDKVAKSYERMGKKYPEELKKALKKTIIYGFRVAGEETPGTGTLKKSWKTDIKDLNNGTVKLVNSAGYAELVEKGWKRTRPITPKNAKVLIFKTKGFKGSQRPSTRTLYKRYKAAKGTAKEKTAKTGIVVTRIVKTPAKFKGHKFIEKKIVPSIQKRLGLEIKLANRRVLSGSL